MQYSALLFAFLFPAALLASAESVDDQRAPQLYARSTPPVQVAALQQQQQQLQGCSYQIHPTPCTYQVHYPCAPGADAQSQKQQAAPSAPPKEEDNFLIYTRTLPNGKKHLKLCVNYLMNDQGELEDYTPTENDLKEGDTLVEPSMCEMNEVQLKKLKSLIDAKKQEDDKVDKVKAAKKEAEKSAPAVVASQAVSNPQEEIITLSKTCNNQVVKLVCSPTTTGSSGIASNSDSTTSNKGNNDSTNTKDKNNDKNGNTNTGGSVAASANPSSTNTASTGTQETTQQSEASTLLRLNVFASFVVTMVATMMFF